LCNILGLRGVRLQRRLQSNFLFLKVDPLGVKMIYNDDNGIKISLE